MTGVLEDNYGRPLTHLRISVTSNCNYRCIFCHREGEINRPDGLTPEMIGLVGEAAYRLGIRFFKITGGEPLLRKDIGEIIRQLKFPGSEVSLTTNGFFLEERIDELLEAGLDRANVSLHSIHRENYRRITGIDGLENVLRGLESARKNDLPVKLNFVLTRYNIGEVGDIINYASDMGFNVNIIELIPVGLGAISFNKLFVKIDEVVPQLLRYARKVEIRKLQSRPRIYLDSGIYVELIASYCNPYFCASCTKIRLTHDGMLKPCINRNDNLVEVKHILRDRGLTREEKVSKLMEAIKEANKRREPFFKIREGACMAARGSIRGEPRFPLKSFLKVLESTPRRPLHR